MAGVLMERDMLRYNHPTPGGSSATLSDTPGAATVSPGSVTGTLRTLTSPHEQAGGGVDSPIPAAWPHRAL